MINDGVSTDEIKGRAKQATGTVMGDEGLEREGRMDRVVGDVKDTVDRVADKVKGLVNRDDR